MSVTLPATFSPDWGTPGHRYTLVRVEGACLEPTLRDGALVLVDVSAQPADGDILVLLHQQLYLIRRLEAGQLVGHGHDPLPLAEVDRVIGVVDRAALHKSA